MGRGSWLRSCSTGTHLCFSGPLFHLLIPKNHVSASQRRVRETKSQAEGPQPKPLTQDGDLDAHSQAITRQFPLTGSLSLSCAFVHLQSGLEYPRKGNVEYWPKFYTLCTSKTRSPTDCLGLNSQWTVLLEATCHVAMVQRWVLS